MLIEFSLGNFWSFDDVETLQLQAAKIVSKHPGLDDRNITVTEEKVKILKTKAIYGANASGKTNLVRGLSSMVRIICECLQDMEVLQKRITPFLLDSSKADAPTFFQLIFVVNQTLYRYGFEATKEKITAEWLFGKPLNGEGKVKERYYFTREEMTVQVNEKIYKEGKPFAGAKKGVLPLFRKNSLFLTVVAAWNGVIAKELVHYIQSSYMVLSGLKNDKGKELAMNAMNDVRFRQKTTALLQAIDPTIKRIERIEIDVDLMNLPFGERQRVQAIREQGHKLGDVAIVRSGGVEGQEVSLRLSSQEAEGTKKLFALSPFIFSALDQGKVLVVDEFDARMHPKLTRKVIELFHSTRTNPHHGQLIFITHDTNLLDGKLLRRDQISFARKDEKGATELYSLAEFKGVRNDASFEKDYLQGKYYAIPSNLNMLEEAVVAYIHAKEK